jgi:hypothetical protein
VDDADEQAKEITGYFTARSSVDGWGGDDVLP